MQKLSRNAEQLFRLVKRDVKNPYWLQPYDRAGDFNPPIPWMIARWLVERYGTTPEYLACTPEERDAVREAAWDEHIRYFNPEKEHAR